MNANICNYTDEEISQCEKALGVKFSTKNRHLLQAGHYSELIDGINDPEDNNLKRSAKFHLYRNSKHEVSINIYYKKETLFIPDSINGHKLEVDEKEQLVAGNVVQIKGSAGQNLYLKVDKDLNAIIVSGDRELGIPDVIGDNKKFGFEGYVLSDTDKLTIAGGGILEPKVMCGEDGYFVARMGFTEDKKGIMFMDYQTIPEEKVEAYIEKYNKASEIKPEKNLTVEDKLQEKPQHNIDKEKECRDLDIEFQNAVEKRDFVKLNQLSEEGYKPADMQIRKIESIGGLSDNEKIALKAIFGIKDESLQLENGKKQSKSPEIKREEERTNVVLKAGKNKKRDGRTIEKVGNVLNQGFHNM